jgi:hypothetical protein
VNDLVRPVSLLPTLCYHLRMTRMSFSARTGPQSAVPVMQTAVCPTCPSDFLSQLICSLSKRISDEVTRFICEAATKTLVRSSPDDTSCRSYMAQPWLCRSAVVTSISPSKANPEYESVQHISRSVTCSCMAGNVRNHIASLHNVVRRGLSPSLTLAISNLSIRPVYFPNNFKCYSSNLL